MRRIFACLISSRSTQAKAHPRARLAVEMLEDRRLMAIAPVRGTTAPVLVDPTLAWIDNNIQDANLRSLARQSQNDDVLSRTEMISLLNQAAQGGVNSVEFTDLADLLSRPDLLGTPGYVQELAENVVHGDPANAHYQGGSLGNLYSGSTATHLNKLTWKWFFGADRPVLPAGEGYTYQYASGTLFQGLPSFADVDQGSLGDCWFLASLEEVALRSPGLIQNMFIDNGDGTFTVRFFRGGSSNPEYVTVDRYLPVDDDQNHTFAFANGSDPYNDPTNILWPALAEKAYAQLNESGWINSGGEDNSYWDLDGGFADVALNHITGQLAVMFSMPDSAETVLGMALGADFLAGKMIVFCTDVEGVAANIVPRHCYAMLGYNSATGAFTLGNPWGTNAEVNDLPGGIITLTTHQLFNNFRAFVEVAPSQAITTLDTILHSTHIPEVWPAVIVDWIPNIIDYEIPVLRDTISIATIRQVEFRGAGDEGSPDLVEAYVAAPSARACENEPENFATLADEVFADPASLRSFTKTGQIAADLFAMPDEESPSLAELDELDDLVAALAAT
jgi:hypothetical protein